MNIAIMQPYIFPYIGYFQLINSVDTFVFYDDVHFIKRGWINRNQILVNEKSYMFSIPLNNASQNKLINEVDLLIDEKWKQKFFTTLEYNYKKAPFFENTFDFVKNIFSINHNNVAELCIKSIIEISKFLNINTEFKISSLDFNQTKGMDRADRLIEICKLYKSKTYINPRGGKDLYSKIYFEENGINLLFIENKISPYPQFTSNFIGGLSIIDVLMFNSKEQINYMLNDYNLV